MTFLLKKGWALTLLLCLSSQWIMAQKNKFFYEEVPSDLVSIVGSKESKITTKEFDKQAALLIIKGKSKKIKAVLLTNQGLEKYPRELWQFSNLRELWLSDNQFQIIDKASFSKMKKLTSLNLSNNKLVVVPESIGALKKLEMLSFGHNKLTSLPAAIGNLKKLRHLYIDNNRLVALPKEIGNLKSLEMLVMDNNPTLTKLPKEFAKLKKLTNLRLHNVPLKTLPKEIAQMTGLRNVYLHKSQKALGEQFKKLIPSVRINY
jgi:Leucine-rich repeat (LRR) protein